jgi:hypothetical protein
LLCRRGEVDGAGWGLELNWGKGEFDEGLSWVGLETVVDGLGWTEEKG